MFLLVERLVSIPAGMTIEIQLGLLPVDMLSVMLVVMELETDMCCVRS